MGRLFALQILAVIPLWRVFARAGLAAPLSLLVLTPGIGWVIVGLILALSRWPALESAGRGA